MISLKNVHKTYTPDKTPITALAGVDAHIDSGDFVALMGPSGSGKSTLLHLIAGLDAPTLGHITIDGDQLDTLNEQELTDLRRTRVGIVFQAFNLIGVLTALQNVAIPCTLAGGLPRTCDQAALDALARVGLDSRAAAYPAQLSGGEQQRVAIARALINNPTVLLADEPTGNLDHETGIRILQLLRDLNTAGQTIIMATHDPSAASFASRVLTIRDGVIAKTTNIRNSARPSRSMPSIVEASNEREG